MAYWNNVEFFLNIKSISVPFWRGSLLHCKLFNLLSLYSQSFMHPTLSFEPSILEAQAEISSLKGLTHPSFTLPVQHTGPGRGNNYTGDAGGK